MLREDFAFFHAARQSAFDDPVAKDYLQQRSTDSDIGEKLESRYKGIVENYKSGYRRRPAGTTLLFEGDVCKELYILLDGWVARSRCLDNGKRLTLNFHMPGAFLGFQTDLLAPSGSTIRCITETVVCVFPRTAFTSLLKNNTALGSALEFSKAEDEKRMQENLINIATRPARARIANLILTLHKRIVSVYPEENHADVHWPLTQQDIADTLGLSNVHVNRALRTLDKEQVLSLKKNRLQIHDFEILSDIARNSDR
ncbi:MAG: Crp/Fnr family transcriptional regulator [Granulosicoccus sp.]